MLVLWRRTVMEFTMTDVQKNDTCNKSVRWVSWNIHYNWVCFLFDLRHNSTFIIFICLVSIRKTEIFIRTVVCRSYDKQMPQLKKKYFWQFLFIVAHSRKTSCWNVYDLTALHILPPNQSLIYPRGPQALTVTRVPETETLHPLLVREAHICITTAN